MPTTDSLLKDINKAIAMLAGRYSFSQVYYDWITLLGLACAQAGHPIHDKIWEDREKRYRDTASKYTKDELATFTQLTAHLTDLFELDHFYDWLGRIYMESVGGNKHTGQCFTPMSVTQCMAGLTFHPEDKPPPWRINDCAVGGGATLLGFAGEVYRRGYNPQTDLVLEASDIDLTCVYMSLIQFTLTGLRAVVYCTDTLANPPPNVPAANTYFTPWYLCPAQLYKEDSVNGPL